MYPEELEKLIELALLDGVITEKKKQVLLKKAEVLEIDIDEFEMVLDARIYEKQKNTSLAEIKITDSLESAEGFLNSDTISVIKNGSILATAAFALCKAAAKETDKHLPIELADIVKKHAIAATVAGAGSGWIPLVGATLGTTITAGIIFSMFVKISNKLELPFKDNLIKGIVSGISAILLGFLGGWALGTAVSLIPGVGTVASVIVDATQCFCLTLVSGILCFKTLTKILENETDLSQLTDEDLQNIAKEVAGKEDIKFLMHEAKEEYKLSKKNGEIKNAKNNLEIKNIIDSVSLKMSDTGEKIKKSVSEVSDNVKNSMNTASQKISETSTDIIKSIKSFRKK